MYDEFPKVDPTHRGKNPHNEKLNAGMVVAAESYMGSKGESNGAKLEEQMPIPETGYKMLSSYPMEE